MKMPSYSTPSLNWRDGAHRSSRPWVPTAYPITGRLPGPIHGAFGTITEPETAVG